MRHLVLLVSVLGAVFAGTTACASTTNGTAVGPGETADSQPSSRPATASRRPSTTSSRPGAGSGPLAGKDPCTLLPAAGQGELGISNGENDTIGSGRRCRWRLRGPQDTYIFDVVIYDRLGLKDVPNDGKSIKLPNIGGHEAVQAKETGGRGTCLIELGVTESSRVATAVVAGTDTQKACDLAMQLARLVEPQLP